MNEDLIGLIYEAGAMPHRWPDVLDRLARHVGSRGGLLFAPTRSGRFIASPSLDGIMADFAAGGWAAHNGARIAERLITHPTPGFFTDLDCHTIEEMDRLPIYAGFLRPRGVDVGAGTIVRGSDGGGIAFTLEGFASHAAARASVSLLNDLRPHIARAVTLSTRIEADRLDTAVRTLEAVGLPAAVLGPTGRLLAANGAFERMMDLFGVEGARGFQLRRSGANDLLAEALARRAGGLGGRTIPIGPVGADVPTALHLIPVEGSARDLFAAGATLAIIGQGARADASDGVFLETLFDLTVAEARLARSLLAGDSMPAVAQGFGLSPETVRTQLKALFAKTGVRRQIDLVRLFDRLSPPPGPGMGDGDPTLQ